MSTLKRLPWWGWALGGAAAYLAWRHFGRRRLGPPPPAGLVNAQTGLQSTTLAGGPYNPLASTASTNN